MKHTSSKRIRRVLKRAVKDAAHVVGLATLFAVAFTAYVLAPAHAWAIRLVVEKAVASWWDSFEQPAKRARLYRHPVRRPPRQRL